MRPAVVIWRERLRDSDEDAVTKHVGMMMSTRMDPKGRGATMSVETQMADTGLSRSSVKRGNTALKKKWVRCTPGGGRGNTNRYDIKGVPTEPVSTPPKGVQKQVPTEPVPEKPVQERAERGPQPARNGSSQDPEVVTAEQGTAEQEGAGRRRDEVWDAVIEACGLDPTELTKQGRGAANNAVRQLRDVAATPEEIHRRAARHRTQWSGATLTPSSLAKNWAQLGASTELATANTVDEVDAWLARTNGGAP